MHTSVEMEIRVLKATIKRLDTRITQLRADVDHPGEEPFIEILEDEKGACQERLFNLEFPA